MGSGKYLRHSQKKYGLSNFTKEILFIFDNPKEMYAKEAEIVNKDFLAETNTYNIKIGGFGGWDYINENPDKYLTEKRLSSLMTNSERSKRWKIKYETDCSFREKAKNNLKLAKIKQKEKYPEGTFKGKKHSIESREKISIAAKNNSKGAKNSQFGTIWITNGTENKKILKDEQIPFNWYRGRSIG